MAEIPLDLLLRGKIRDIHICPDARISLSKTMFPAGIIEMYGGTVVPVGWLLCNGAAVSRTMYKSLFDVIGTTFGAGDGSTTFNIPDLRQRFPLGRADAGTGSVLGRVGGTIDHIHSSPTHTHSSPTHTHSVPTHTHGFTPSGTISTPTFTGAAGTTGSAG